MSRYFLLGLVALNITGFVRGQSDRCTDTPCDCSQPDILDCSGRGLTEIPQFNGLFSGVLKLVDFSDNNFVTFDPDGFGFNFISVTRIEVLDLSNNKLTSIENSFAVTNKAPLYDKLDLSNNNFTAFPGKALPLQFRRIILEIDISNNQLTTLPMNFVANNVMESIPTLKLTARNNLINHIHPMAFSGGKVIGVLLDLRGNRLTNISQDFFFPASDNREFKMADNPWNCDCNFRWILTSDFRDLSASAAPVCNEPDPLRSRKLFELKAGDFVCPPEENGNQREVEINKGDNILSCPATADPQSSLNITWSFSLACQAGSQPLKLIAQSNTATIGNVSCFPESNITCTAENYAGSIGLDLNALRSDDIDSCPMDARGNGGGNGGFVFLVILVVISILICLALGGYLFYLWMKIRDSSFA